MFMYASEADISGRYSAPLLFVKDQLKRGGKDATKATKFLQMHMMPTRQHLCVGKSANNSTSTRPHTSFRAMFGALLNSVKNFLSICGQVSLASCARLMKTTFGYAIFKELNLLSH